MFVPQSFIERVSGSAREPRGDRDAIRMAISCPLVCRLDKLPPDASAAVPFVHDQRAQHGNRPIGMHDRHDVSSRDAHWLMMHVRHKDSRPGMGSELGQSCLDSRR